MIRLATRTVLLGVATILLTGCPQGSSMYITMPTGLKYRELVEGTGQAVEVGDTIVVHYTGRLKDGTKFDSSYDHPGQQPFEFKLGKGIIKGWQEGIPGMKVGGKRKLIIPPSLAYEDAGKPPDIPPRATLYFEIELLEIK